MSEICVAFLWKITVDMSHNVVCGGVDYKVWYEGKHYKLHFCPPKKVSSKRPLGVIFLKIPTTDELYQYSFLCVEFYVVFIAPICLDHPHNATSK